MNPDDLENRLRALPVPEPPPDLMFRLLGAEPSAPPDRWQAWRGLFTGPWRFAYAGVLAAWVAVAVLHLLTLPLLPADAGNAPAVAQSGPSATPANAYPPERMLLLTRADSLDPSWQ